MKQTEDIICCIINEFIFIGVGVRVQAFLRLCAAVRSPSALLSTESEGLTLHLLSPENAHTHTNSISPLCFSPLILKVSAHPYHFHFFCLKLPLLAVCEVILDDNTEHEALCAKATADAEIPHKSEKTNMRSHLGELLPLKSNKANN